MVRKKKRSSKKTKEYRVVPEGIAHISSSFNNTIVAITDLTGNVLSWKSAGMLGFKGSKKSTPYAAQRVAEEVVLFCQERHGLKSIVIRVKGPGAGRDTAIRSLGNSGLVIKEICDVTPLPHNGVRPRKRPRG